MNDHKKRSKGDWRQGKGYKGDGEERQFSKNEVKQQLAEDEETYLDRHKGKKKRNKLASLEYRVKWYEETIAKYEKDNKNSMLCNWFRDSLEKTKKQLAELKKKQDK